MTTTLTELVEVAAAMSATRSRRAKVAALADLLQRLEEAEVAVAVGMLLGEPRQGRLGVGWRTLQRARTEASPTATLTLVEVDAALTVLAEGRGPGSAGVRTAAVAALLGAATEAEQDFLVRVILGDMRTGALDGVVVDAVAAASGRPPAVVRRAAMLTGAIGDTARLALTGSALTDIGVTPGVPVQPMLASSASSVAAAMTQIGEASVEAKLDGARIQVHRAGGDIRAYTRSLADITDRVPEVVELVAGLPGGDLVLDGETLRLDPSGRARPFAETMSRFGSHGNHEPLTTFFFDLLHADGADLIDVPLRRRRELLRDRVTESVVPGIVTDDSATAEQFFTDTVAAGHEGVVVKGIDSTYEAGRRGRRWIKVKPVHTADLVVLAAEWGYGRRTGRLSNLHLGARDLDGGFVMVGKTFKGLTDELLHWQTEYFPTIATREEPGVVHVRPSTVVEVAFDGVQRSTRYRGGVALRFARVKRYRIGADAKPAAEADTIETLRAMLR